MPAKPEQTVGRWLSGMGIQISPALLKKKLQSHTEYPSLLSITDTLDELCIDNAALQIDKERLQEVPLPFLAHYGNEFLVITDIQTQVGGKPEFEKNWNGTALLAEKPDNWRNEENEKALAKENKRRQINLVSILAFAVLGGFSLYFGHSWQGAGLLLTGITGFAVAILIVQHELGISNELTEQLCAAGKNTDCDAVLHSKGSHLSKWLNWADAGIIYFSSYLLLLVILLYTGNTDGIFLPAVLSCAAVPFTLFSLYYQWRVVKKWCTLCLLTVAILWVQFALMLPAILTLWNSDFLNIISVNNLLLAAFILAGISAAWILALKPELKRNSELEKTNFSLLRFKNNLEIFNALLKQQRKVDTIPFENDLQLGNPDAAVQVMVACNPYCGPCATAHEALHELAETKDIGLTIRLSVKAEDYEDKRTIAGKYIMQVVNNMGADFKRKVLHDWYALMDLKKFGEKYPLQKEAYVQQQMQEHEQWNKEAKIEFTPTIFINGYQLPKQYKTEDLKIFLRRIEKITETSDERIVENNIVLM